MSIFSRKNLHKTFANSARYANHLTNVKYVYNKIGLALVLVGFTMYKKGTHQTNDCEPKISNDCFELPCNGSSANFWHRQRECDYQSKRYEKLEFVGYLIGLCNEKTCKTVCLACSKSRISAQNSTWAGMK